VNAAINGLVRRLLSPHATAESEADPWVEPTFHEFYGRTDDGHEELEPRVPVDMAPAAPLAAAYARRIIGSTDQIELALEALARVGIEGKTLALAAIEAVGVIDRLGGKVEVELHRHVRQENTGSGGVRR
jgi:hypothetical protein